MEAVVATVVSVIAVLGLAHTFGIGRGFIERFSIGRNALGVAQARMEALCVLPASTAPELATGVHAAIPFLHLGQPLGTEQWRVQWFDDPATSATSLDLKQITVVVTWKQGIDQDSLKLTRLVIP